MRYFFDIVDENGITRDTDGILLGGAKQMRQEAQRALTEIAVEEPWRAGQVNLAIRVRDEADREVYNIRLHIEGRAA